jgi:hypothetical protein
MPSEVPESARQLLDRIQNLLDYAITRAEKKAKDGAPLGLKLRHAMTLALRIIDMQTDLPERRGEERKLNLRALSLD